MVTHSLYGYIFRDDIMSIILLYYIVNAIPIKIPTQCFTETESNNPKFHTETQKNQIAKTTLNSKRTPGDSTTLDFKLNCRTIVIKTTWYLHKNRHNDQQSVIEDPHITPHLL